MSKIIEISQLYNSSLLKVIGYVGLDLETNQKRFFFCTSENAIRSDLLREFNPLTIDKTSPFYNLLLHCDYRVHLPSSHPKALDNALKRAIRLQKRFALMHGLPLDYFENNLKGLKLYYDECCASQNSYADYRPVDNMIVSYLRFYLDDQEIVNGSFLHEIGHLRTSAFKIDEQKKEIWVKVGFQEYTLALEVLKTLTGDTFYLPKTLSPTLANCPAIAFDEIITDYECMLMDPKFMPTYPMLGKEINDLLDGNSFYFRATTGQNGLCEYLLGIDPSENLLHDFLGTVRECVYYNSTLSQNQARRLIKHYEERKKK